MAITSKDDELIAILRGNARLSVSEIARRMSSSRTAIQMRLRKLERNGVIQGYTVRLSPDYDQKNLQALVMIKFSPKNRASIEAELTAIPQVTALYSISGDFDMAAVISTRSMDRLDLIIDQIGCLSGIGETMSSIILSTKIDR